ncbi:MAG: dihydrofolate reductase [Succinivibrionaceae bacterium]|nr:dihydrofolate reductase [Succinivibrionaceae bacterium]
MTASLRIALIAAVDLDLAIGRDNRIPWHLPADMKYFRQRTMGKTIVMGRNTFASLGYRQLPGRRSVVVTAEAGFGSKWQVETAATPEQAIASCPAGEEEIMIIGGGRLYRSCISMASRLYITLVHTRVGDADTFFPEFEQSFTLTEVTEKEADEKNPFACSFRVYDRL